ncbi:multidrug effflux MFS transporter [Vibrio sp. S4M6]|uniref:multidrug effflux MFS transporter n=1 Tax=Vibrio sinus TaxID=2946865 RepID=UPI00202AB7C0|nr:multidrug effflux MFS transporter [Vibrio sinus]MCL9780949.1 multidrug effflux MFS transporter [Vibrio sinus]
MKFAKFPDQMTLVCLILGPMVAIITLSLDIYAPSLPNMARSLSSTTVQAQLTMTAYTFAMGFGQLISGPLSDKFGRRKSAIAAMLVYTLASVVCGLVQDVTVLIAVRVLQGLAASAAVVTAFAIIRDKYAGIEAAKGFGILSSATTLGTIIGPVIGGLLQEHFHSFRAAFVALSLFGALALVIAVMFVEDTSSSQAPSSFTSVFRNYGKILSDKHLLSYSVFSIASVILFFTLSSVSPFILIEQYHVSQSMYGVYFASLAVMFMLGALSANKYVGRLGINRSILIGSSFMLFGALMMLLANTYIAKNALTFIIPAWFLFWGVAFSFGPSISAAMENYKTIAGSASAALASIRYGLGSVIGTAFLSLYSPSSMHLGWFFLVLAAILFAVVLSKFARRSKVLSH